MSGIYLGALLISIGCMVLLDRRFTLFFWRAPGRAAAVLAIGLAFFLAWDVAGITLGIFFREVNTISTGILVAPHLPIEEVVFLAFLGYLTMVLYSGCLALRSQLASRRRGPIAADSGARDAAAGESAQGASSRRAEGRPS
jgi:lycopene cyclase domain-containing protein